MTPEERLAKARELLTASDAGAYIYRVYDIEQDVKRLAAALAEAEERGREEARAPVVPEATKKQIFKILHEHFGLSVGVQVRGFTVSERILALLESPASVLPKCKECGASYDP